MLFRNVKVGIHVLRSRERIESDSKNDKGGEGENDHKLERKKDGKNKLNRRAGKK